MEKIGFISLRKKFREVNTHTVRYSLQENYPTMQISKCKQKKYFPRLYARLTSPVVLILAHTFCWYLIYHFLLYL